MGGKFRGEGYQKGVMDRNYKIVSNVSELLFNLGIGAVFSHETLLIMGENHQELR